MRSAAQRQEDDPGPEPAGLDARAARVLDADLALIMRIDATLAAWGTACPHDSMAVPVLRDLGALVIDAGHHVEDLRREMAAHTATAGALEAAFKAGRAAERAEQAPAVPAPGRHAAERGSRRLKAVRDLPVAAFAGAAFAGLRHAWAAHPAATAAAGVTVATFAAATAVVAPHAAATFGASPSSPAPAASIWSATPVPAPSQKLIAAVSGRKGPARTLGTGLPPAYPSYAPQDAPSSPAGNPGPGPSSLPVSVPDVRLVVTSALDLGTGQSGTIRITAFGGTVSWSASASVAGLALDQSSGSLAAGDSATVTVSIRADLQALTGPGSVTIDYGDGKQAVVPVSWTVVPLPVPLPTDTTLPVPLPSLPASGA